MKLSPKTVRTYRSRIFEKTGFASTSELMFHAIDGRLATNAEDARASVRLSRSAEGPPSADHKHEGLPSAVAGHLSAPQLTQPPYEHNLSDNTRRQFKMRIGLAAVFCVVFVSGTAAQFMGWDVTAANRDERSPLASVSGAATRGRTLFVTNCARCHGPEGKGNGSDSDHAADLTDDLRASLNTEGVLFYKIWNGHLIQLRTAVEDMPAFRDRLSRDQVWAIVEYLKALRTPRP